MDALRTDRQGRQFAHSQEWCRLVKEVCGHRGRAFATALEATKLSGGDPVVALELIADRASALRGPDLETLRLLLTHALVLVVAAELDPADEPTDLATEACLARLGVRPATLALAVAPRVPTRRSGVARPRPASVLAIDPIRPARRSA
jgi:hypothetical protein